ncbi:MAG: hypothetical protein WC725_03530 [Patescibacteria group bacterium]|jgi:hypothetical protein
MNLDEHLKNSYSQALLTEVDLEATRSKIMIQVSRLNKRRILIRSGFWSVFTFVSTLGLVTSSIGFYQQFIGSGARELIVVAITDTSVILQNGTAFFYSLAESMPVGNIAGTLAATAAFLYSLQHLSELLMNNLSKKIYGHKPTN